MSGIMTLRFGKNPVAGTATPVPGGPDAGILAAGFVTVSGTTPTLQTSKNVASIARSAFGVYTITYGSTLSTSNYGVLLGVRDVSSSSDRSILIMPNRLTTGGFNRYSTTEVDIEIALPGSTVADPANFSFIIFDPNALSSAKYLAAAMMTASGSTYTLQRQKNVASLTRITDGVVRKTFSSALSDAEYCFLVNSRWPDAANGDPVMSGNNTNSGNTSVHGTASAIATYGQYTDGSSLFDIGKASAMFFKGDDPPPGTLAAASVTLSGTSIVSQRTHNCTVSRTATGLFRATYALPMPNANYGTICAAKLVGAASNKVATVGPNRNTSSGNGLYSTTAVDIFVMNNTNNSYSAVDPERLDIWCYDPASM